MKAEIVRTVPKDGQDVTEILITVRHLPPVYTGCIPVGMVYTIANVKGIVGKTTNAVWGTSPRLAEGLTEGTHPNRNIPAPQSRSLQWVQSFCNLLVLSTLLGGHRTHIGCVCEVGSSSTTKRCLLVDVPPNTRADLADEHLRRRRSWRN